MKAFTVSGDWIEYAHGPAAEEGQPLAVEIMNLPGKRTVKIPADRRDMVEEIVSVAGLYSGSYGGDAEDRARARRAAAIIKKGREWLTVRETAGQGDCT